MKKLKLMMMLASMMFVFNTSYAQTSKSAVAKTPAATSAKAEEKKRPNADGRTKTGDKINRELKGPKGETVYTGPKGGNYYLGKSDEKIYLGKGVK
jgi:colicin import membrane protein